MTKHLRRWTNQTACNRRFIPTSGPVQRNRASGNDITVTENWRKVTCKNCRKTLFFKDVKRNPTLGGK